MRRVLHLLTTDSRRMAPWVLVWSGFLLTRFLLLRTFWKGGDEPALFLESMALHPWTLLILLVPLALQQDRPGGSEALWLTRPIPGWEMAASKALFVGLGILLPMVVVQSLALLDFGLAPGRLPAALLDGVVVELMVVAMLSILAVLTQGMSDYLLTFLGFYALDAITVGVLSTASLLKSDGIGVIGRLLEGKDIVLESGALLALSLLILAHQYLTRRSGRSLLMIGVGAVLLLVLQPGLKRAPSLPVGISSDHAVPEESEVRLVLKPVSTDGEESQVTLFDWPLVFEIEGLAADPDCWRARFQGTLRFRNGTMARLREAVPLVSSCVTSANFSSSSEGSPVELSPSKSDAMEIRLIPADDFEFSGISDADLEGELSIETLRLHAREARRPMAGDFLLEGDRRLRVDSVQYTEERAKVRLHARDLKLRDSQTAALAEVFLVSQGSASGSAANPFEHLAQPRRLLMARPSLWAGTTELSTKVRADLPEELEELLLVEVELAPVAMQRASVRLEGALTGVWTNWDQEVSR